MNRPAHLLQRFAVCLGKAQRDIWRDRRVFHCVIERRDRGIKSAPSGTLLSGKQGQTVLFRHSRVGGNPYFHGKYEDGSPPTRG